MFNNRTERVLGKVLDKPPEIISDDNRYENSVGLGT
jgi:hypothetical protein